MKHFTLYKPWSLALHLMLLGPLIGCQQYLKCARYSGSETNCFLGHRSPIVKYPAYVGGGIGVIAGIPITVPYVLIMGTLESFNIPNKKQVISKDHVEEDYYNMMLAPSVISATLCEYTVGAPCWVLFGWWWPEPNAVQHGSPTADKTEQSSSDATMKVHSHSTSYSDR